MKLAGLLQHPDPIIINHTIRWGHSAGTALRGFGWARWAMVPGLKGLHGMGSVPGTGGAQWVGD